MKANLIFRLRQEKGWTQSELARILSVPEKTLAKWENGIGFPNIKTFELLIRVSGKTVTELLGQDDALLEAIAIYKGEIKTRNRIIVTLVAVSVGLNGFDWIWLFMPADSLLSHRNYVPFHWAAAEKEEEQITEPIHLRRVLFSISSCILCIPSYHCTRCLWRTGSNVRNLF